MILPGDVPLTMVLVPEGSFIMGAPQEERGRNYVESPQTSVVISQDFYMGKYEVTQAQWAAVMGEEWPNLGFPGRPDNPVEMVSWNDAQSFILALNAHLAATGQGGAIMRLPTEAEWEYAARAGTSTRFHFGDSLIGTSGGDNCEDDGLRSQYMWYCGNAGGQTNPVGVKLPNAFGLHGMHGNVAEHCQDWYAESLPGGSVVYPMGPDTGTTQVVRGGTWIAGARAARSANRQGSSPDARSNRLGFRLAALVGEEVPSPGVGIVSPSANQTVANATTSVAFAGHSWAPGSNVTSVQWRLNGGAWQNLSTRSTWIFTVTGLRVGANLVEVRATNSLGSQSTATRAIVRGGGDGKTSETTVTLPGGVPLVMLRIPQGSFIMGSPLDERGRRTDRESPLTHVTISRDFHLGKYEVTQAQWEAVMGSNPSEFAGNPNNPVERVAWSAAIGFISALNAHLESTGQGEVTMRLPTEAEWEYAARAGSTTRFSFGNSLIGASGGDNCEDDGLRSQYMWYCGNSNSQTHPVGQKLPNGFGLHDMHGNVWEWCHDIFGNLPGGIVIDPTGEYMGFNRVLKGGAYSSNAAVCRSASRDLYQTMTPSSIWGFRLAATFDFPATPPIPQPSEVRDMVIGSGEASLSADLNTDQTLDAADIHSAILLAE